MNSIDNFRPVLQVKIHFDGSILTEIQFGVRNLRQLGELSEIDYFQFV